MEQVTIAEAARRLGVSQDTVKRKLRRGELKGRQQPRPQGFTWIIELEEDGLGESVTDAKTEARTGASTTARTGELHLLEEMVSTLRAQIAGQQEQLTVKDSQLETKDHQIEQLHVLVQQAQAALPAPRENRRSWWRWW